MTSTAETLKATFANSTPKKRGVHCASTKVRTTTTYYAPQHNTRIPLEQHPEFTTALYRIDTAYRIDYRKLDSFVILIAFEGAARLTDNENNTTLLRAGETLLYPATTQFVDVVPLEPTFLASRLTSMHNK